MIMKASKMDRHVEHSATEKYVTLSHEEQIKGSTSTYRVIRSLHNKGHVSTTRVTHGYVLCLVLVFPFFYFSY